MGHPTKPVFAIAFRGKFSNQCQVLLLPTAMSPKEFLFDQTCSHRRSTTLSAKNE